MTAECHVPKEPSPRLETLLGRRSCAIEHPNPLQPSPALSNPFPPSPALSHGVGVLQGGGASQMRWSPPLPAERYVKARRSDLEWLASWYYLSHCVQNPNRLSEFRLNSGLKK